MSDQHNFLAFFLREPVYVVPEPESLFSSSVPEIPRWGRGRQEILILAREPEYEFLAPSDQTFLEKVLQAVSLASDDITLINTERLIELTQQGSSVDDLLATIPHRTGLVFGEAPDQWSLGGVLAPYVIEESDDRRWLLADPLNEIATNTDKKALLWKGLQQLFKV